MPIILVTLLAFLLMSCTQKPPVFVNPPPNPNAPLAFMGEGNMSQNMRNEYAAALQNSGLYNFATENFTEDQVEKAVEVRLNYEETGKNVCVLKAELIKDQSVWLSTTLTEEGKDKKERKRALLERFLAEVNRRVSE